MQGGLLTRASLVNQQQISIGSQLCELSSEYRGRADRILAWPSHYGNDRIGKRRTTRGGDDSHMNWELPAIWPTGILRHMEYAAACNLCHPRQRAGRKLDSCRLDHRR